MLDPETVDTAILVIFIGTAIAAVGAIVMPWSFGRASRVKSTPYDNYRRVFGLLAAVPMPWFSLRVLRSFSAWDISDPDKAAEWMASME